MFADVFNTKLAVQHAKNIYESEVIHWQKFIIFSKKEIYV